MTDQENFLTLGSLFSGIGGFELGFEQTGKIKTIWQVEIDAYCRRVLRKHWPAVQRFSDIRDVGAHNLPAVDILCGGFPCQDISTAGKRAGIDGERSGLWSEFSRLIRELRPRYVVVENVAALLFRGMERVLGDLAACGYDAEWQSIRASDVGAPHRRERIWIVAYPQRDRVREQSIFGTECSRASKPELNRTNVAHSERDGWRESAKVFRRRESESALCGKTLANSNGGRFAMQGEPSGRGRFAARSGERMAKPDEQSQIRTAISWEECNPWATEPNVGRVAHGVPARVDRLRGLGNAIVPQIAEFIGQRIVADFFGSSLPPCPPASRVSL
jgi:DNA (cytosine-5)-methyltransferase 1